MLGMSCRKLARAVDCGYRTVYRWEKGDCLPELNMLLKLAEALNVSGCNLEYRSHMGNGTGRTCN